MPMSLLADMTSCRSGPYDLSGSTDWSFHGKGSTGTGDSSAGKGKGDGGRKGFIYRLPNFDSDANIISSQLPADPSDYRCRDIRDAAQESLRTSRDAAAAEATAKVKGGGGKGGDDTQHVGQNNDNGESEVVDRWSTTVYSTDRSRSRVK